MNYFDQTIQSIENSDLGALQNAISKDPQLIHRKGNNGQTLLLLACLTATQDRAIPTKRSTEEQFSAVELILNARASPSEADASGKLLLHVAAISNHFELAKLLLDAEASLDGQLMGARDGSSLARALFYANSQMTQFLSNPPRLIIYGQLQLWDMK